MRKVSKSKLQEILSRRLKLRHPTFYLEDFGGKIGGSVIDDRFHGMDDLKRQKAIWDALEKELGHGHRAIVGMLLAYTEEEWDLPLEGRTKSRHRKAG